MSSNSFGFIRVGIVSPKCRVADTKFNATQIALAFDKLRSENCVIALTPELGLISYSVGDLVYQKTLLDCVLNELSWLVAKSNGCKMLCVVGAPLRIAGQIFNCAVVYSEGIIRGIVPKTYLPNTGEFYDKRFFSSGRCVNVNYIQLFGQNIPFGADLIFYADQFNDLKIGIEICEDLWAVEQPSSKLALGGATLLLNMSASNEILGKYSYRRDLVRQQSARCVAAYAYVSSGPGESSTDTVYSGYGAICENGTLLCELPRFSFSTNVLITDVDIERLVHERIRNTSFMDSQALCFREIPFSIDMGIKNQALVGRTISKYPFIPISQDQRQDHCAEIFNIQIVALAKRIKHSGCERLVIGISGGLDSTLALLVATRTFDILEIPRKNILAVTMPGFGTSLRTKNNAANLIQRLSVSSKNIDICAAVCQHFNDIGHNPHEYNQVYENTQARERTQILMDLANLQSGIVLGTGDLSESALGWCTFNGDQMSSYHINIGVPKTLVHYMVDWCATSVFFGEVSEILIDICNTPISPELLPIMEESGFSKKTEELIGPYELHDFFLFYAVRFHFTPKKILYLANHAFCDKYSKKELIKWIKVFYFRFFQNQFKRSSMPDGPKIGSVALSPRADWRMPSDASPNTWLQSINEIS